MKQTQPKPAEGTLPCGCPGDSPSVLEHLATCPHKARFIWEAVGQDRDEFVERFKNFVVGRTADVWPPYPNWTDPQMCRCECGLWYPCTQVIQCPVCRDRY